MDIKKQLAICYSNYKKWKEKAISGANINTQKAIERAFFWLEIHSAIYAIGLLEASVKSKEEKMKLIEAKKKIIEKLNEYEKLLSEELDF